MAQRGHSPQAQAPGLESQALGWWALPESVQKDHWQAARGPVWRAVSSRVLVWLVPALSALAQRDHSRRAPESELV